MLKKLFPLLLISTAAFGQAGKVGHGGKIGTSAMFTSNSTPIIGGAIPLSDAPIAGTCSTLYDGAYQLGLYSGCTNTPPANYSAEMTSLASTITPRNTSGTIGSGAGFHIILMCGGMSVALAECSSFAAAAGSLTNVRISNQAISNNDDDTWSTPCGATSMISFRISCAPPGSSSLWGTGIYPDPCQSTVGGSSSGSAQCPAQGLPSGTPNQGDRIKAKLITGGLNILQVEVAWWDTANGTLHPYLQGCLQSGFQVTAIYVICNSLDGVHAIDFEANQNTIDATNIEAGIAQSARDLKAIAPNLVQFWMGGRVTAINCISGCANPEPLDFQISLAIRDVVRAQACQLGDYSCPIPTFSVTATALTSNVATYTYTLTTGTAPVSGESVAVSGTTNGGGIFNLTNGTITGTGTGTFTVAITHANVGSASETGTGSADTIDPNAGDLCPKSVSCGGGSVANAAPGMLLMDVQASVSHDGNAHSGMFWSGRNNAVPPQPVAQLEDSTVFFCNGESSSPCLGAVDFGSDGIHLSTAGGVKAGNIMLRVFQNSPWSQPWFN